MADNLSLNSFKTAQDFISGTLNISAIKDEHQQSHAQLCKQNLKKLDELLDSSKSTNREEFEHSKDDVKTSSHPSSQRRQSVLINQHVHKKLNKESSKAQIGFEHDNWNLMLHMIFGVSKSVRNCV
jgi:hypothetical protein